MSGSAAYWLIASALLFGVGAPWLVVRMLSPTLEAGRLTINYRGRPVHSGLGVAWLVWSGSALAVGFLGRSLVGDGLTGELRLAGSLALAAFTLGLFDDAYGSGASKGFRGHLAAVAKGRLSTGALKLFGISAASFSVALLVEAAAPWGVAKSIPVFVLLALIGGAAVALTSNLVNLADLRPGRASKLYLLLAAAGLASVAFGAHVFSAGRFPSILVLAIFLAGPVFATWGPDLGERGMLGDSGANAAGAVAGMFIVTGLPVWGLLAYAAAVFALNVLSERVSFSEVVEANAFLRALDRIGRLRGDDASSERRHA